MLIISQNALLIRMKFRVYVYIEVFDPVKLMHSVYFGQSVLKGDRLMLAPIVSL